MISVNDFLTEKAVKTESALRVYLDTWTNAPEILRDAVAYSLFAGGKRLRPALVLGAAELISGDDVCALPAACALEMIHTYSLIHDDLPAMDDDDLRRGRPTSHKVYGEAIAILAGDALQTMAFDIAVDTGNIVIVREIARAAGVEGMVGGQVLDMESEEKQLTLAQMQRVHSCKTGALIRASVRVGALAAGASVAQLDALSRYGEHIGLAFQIADDILDVVGTEEQIGKPVGSDVANNKSTYPSLVGLDEARRLASHASDQALSALSGFGEEAETLRDLAKYIVSRDR